MYKKVDILRKVVIIMFKESKTSLKLCAPGFSVLATRSHFFGVIMTVEQFLGIGSGLDIASQIGRLGYNLFTNKRDFDYQKWLQGHLEGREDTAVQRRKADLEAAGFNPALAMGQAAGAGPAVARSSTNDLNLGSMLDTMAAANQIRLQKQEVKNAQKQELILNRQINNLEQDNWAKRLQNDVNQVKMLSELGLPVYTKVEKQEDGSNWFGIYLDDDTGQYYKPYARKNAELDYDLSELTKTAQEYQNKLLDVDADWAEAGKVGQFLMGLIRLLK